MKKVLMSVLIGGIFFLVGCSGVKYNAVLYDYAIDWIKEDFVNENKIPDFKDKTFIIDNENYNTIIKTGIEELKVDFEKQMIIVYTFTSIHSGKDYITNMKVDNNKLIIEFNREYQVGVSPNGGSSEPYQRWFIIIMDKINVSSIVIEGNRGA